MLFFHFTVLTFLVSVVASLAFEMPFANLERLFLSKKKKPKTLAISRSDINNSNQLTSSIEVQQQL